MNRTHSLTIVAAGAALATLAWLTWRSSTSAPAPASPEDAAALAAPPAEKLAALESAEAGAVPAIESQAGPAREAVEVRTIQTRSASITVQPPKVASENRGMIIVWCYLECSHASIDPEEIVLLAPDGRELRGTDERQKGTFRGLAGGSYSVLVRDSRFENVRVDSVATGSHVLIDMLGTARVRPHAVDAGTGAPIATNTLRLVDFGREKEFPPDAEGWFTGLPGGDLDLRISAPGYEESRLATRGLLPGESREVDVRFSRAGEIRGVVVGESSGAPMANVYVRLEWRGEPETMAERIARGMSDRGPPLRSDDQGRFAITGLRLGDYSVVASQGSMLDSVAQDVVLGAGDSVKELVLRVPASCSLSGSLICGAGESVEDRLGRLRVLAQLPGTPGNQFPEYAEALVQPDGRFEFTAALPVGRMQVFFAMRSRASGRDAGPRAPGARPLGALELHAGRNECSFDVSELLPSWAEVELAASGVELDGGTLLVASREEGRETESYAFQGNSAVVGPLPPGEYWLLAHGAGEGWCSATPAALHIERDEVAHVRLELHLAQGRLELQDLDGEPLSEGTQVSIRGASSDGLAAWTRLRPRLGEKGELALALEPGSYMIGMRTEVPLEWTASGPAQAVLRLAPFR